MLHLGFDPGSVQLIMTCVSSVRYQIRVNNDMMETTTPSRGLRQGDPLSPYLFMLCAEGLASLINHEEEEGNFVGTKVCRGAPVMPHLLFADDSLLLMKVDGLNTSSLCCTLDDYCASSGQIVSETKSSVFFSPCTSDAA